MHLRDDEDWCETCGGDGKLVVFGTLGAGHTGQTESRVRCDGCDGAGEVTEAVAAEQEREQAEVDARVAAHNAEIRARVQRCIDCGDVLDRGTCLRCEGRLVYSTTRAA